MPRGPEELRPERRAPGWPLVAGLAALVGAIYAPFLFGDRIFIFPRVGSDTYFQYWPFDRYLGEALAGGHVPGWTFRIGLGQQIFGWASNLNPFALFVRLLPPSLQPEGYVFKMVLECVCAAWLWRRYLLSLGLGGLAAVLVPLLFGFNGYLTLWGQHAMCGVVFSLVPLTLWAYEHFLRRGRWWPLVLSLGLFQASAFYFFVMFAIFFAVFAVMRAAAVMAPGGRGLVRNQFRLAACLLASTSLAAWTLVPMLAYLRTSPRAGPVPVDALSLFPLAQYAGLLRIYSNNVFGTDIWFRGPMNYYELPQLSCGMLPLLLAPQFFRIAGRRERWWAAAAVALVAASLVSPYVAHVFVGFTAPTFRHSFLWIVLCLFLAARVLHAAEAGGRLHRGLLAGTAVALALPAASAAAAAAGIRQGAIVLPAGLAAQGLAMMRALRPQSTAADFSFMLREELAPVVMAQLGAALAALVVYTVLLLLLGRRPRLVGAALLAVAVGEVALLTWPTVNSRVTLSREELRRADGYFDATAGALQLIRAADPSWFRVDKTYRSVFLNDPLFQGYFGTSAYTSVNEPSTLAFLRALEVPTYEDRGPNYVAGFGGRDLLNALAGVKYLLAKEPLERPGYRLLGSARDVLVYLNERALPLGFVMRRTVDPEAFAALPKRRKDLALLEGFVPGESLRAQPQLLARHAPARVDLAETAVSDQAAVESLRREPFEVTFFREDLIRGRVAPAEDGVLFLSIPFNRGWRATVDGREAPLHRIDYGYTGVPVAAGSRAVELKFVPEGSRLGLGVSLVTAVAGCCWLLLARSGGLQRPGGLPGV